MTTARFIVTEPRIGQHSGTCGVCGQPSDQAWARTEILQKTTSNTTVTFPFNTDAICEYCVVMWECGRANPWNRGLLAIPGRVWFPLIAENAEISSPDRPTWANALRALDPALPLTEYLEWLQSVQLSHMRTETQQQNAVQHLKKDKGEDWALSNGFTCTALGLRLDESKGKRGKLIQTRGLLYRRNSGLWHCNPLGYWSHRDVWAYLFSRNVPYHPLYDQETHGFNREELRNSGWLTTDGISRTGRMPWLRQHYRDQYNALVAHFPEVQQFG